MRPLGADAGIRNVRVCTPSAGRILRGGHTLSSEPGTAGGPASVCRNRGASSEVSVASLSLRAPATPASAETARFLPHPIPPGRTRCLERGPPGAQRRPLWTDCDPSLGSSVRLLHLPGNPAPTPSSSSSCFRPRPRGAGDERRPPQAVVVHRAFWNLPSA